MWFGSSEFCLTQRHPFTRQKSEKGENFFLLLQSLGKFKLSDKNRRLQTFLLKSIFFFFFLNCVWHIDFGFWQIEHIFIGAQFRLVSRLHADAYTGGHTWQLVLVFPLHSSIFSLRHILSRVSRRAKILVSCPLPFVSTRQRLCSVPYRDD